MFNNIGRKIKTLAVVMCVLGIIASLALAIFIWSSGSSLSNLFDSGSSYSYGSYYSSRSARDTVSTASILIGFVVLIVGCLFSWLGSFFTYGFGQLIEKTEENNYHLNQIGHMLSEIKSRKS